MGCSSLGIKVEKGMQGNKGVNGITVRYKYYSSMTYYWANGEKGMKGIPGPKGLMKVILSYDSFSFYNLYLYIC